MYVWKNVKNTFSIDFIIINYKENFIIIINNWLLSHISITIFHTIWYSMLMVCVSLNYIKIIKFYRYTNIKFIFRFIFIFNLRLRIIETIFHFLFLHILVNRACAPSHSEFTMVFSETQVNTNSIPKHAPHGWQSPCKPRSRKRTVVIYSQNP